MAQVTDQVADHGGGIRSIRVPIPDNPLGHTLVYMVDTDRGPVLIDTGWDDPSSWDTLTAGLAVCGTSAAEIHGVVITHHHPDHHGLSGRVRETSGAWIAMHSADISIVRRTRENRPERWYAYMAAKLIAAGAPEEHVAPLRTALPRDFPGFSPRSPTARSSPVNSSPCPAAGSARSGPRATPPAMSASIWRSPTRPNSLATGVCSPATICCRRSPRTSACTRTPTTPR